MGDVGVKDAHGVAAAAHAGKHRVGLRATAALLCQYFRHLHQALLANHALEITHHHRIRVRPGHRADDVEGVVHIGHPVAHGLVQGVFQCFTAAFHRHHGGAEQLHPVDVGALALDVLAAHVHHALQAVAGADGGGGHAMLAGTGFGNHTWLAHALGQHGLADGVVDLVCAGVVEVFALEENLRATLFAAHALSVVDR